MDSLRARLEQYGLGKHADLFAANHIDVDILGELTEADLEKLGLALGDRRRILKAIANFGDGAAAPAGPAREAERRQLTVVFADLVDSTKLAARLDPEDMKDLIASYQQAVGGAVRSFGGYVAKPLGDGLLIYFGWPQAHEDDAERAVRSAIAAVAAVRLLATPAGVGLAARIGIATGEVVVGDFQGAGVDETGAVVGETPNLAARLQSAADDHGIIVAEQTMKLAGGQFAFTDLGEQTLKGFDAPVHIWRLDGERTAATRFAAQHRGALGDFIGRSHEIGMLSQRWEEARDGECQLVLIAGEAGIGKSRLVSEFLGRLGGDVPRISYQGSPLHTNTALYPVARYLRSKAGFTDGDPASERWRKLAAAIPSETPRGRLALRFLAELMSIEVPTNETTGTKPSADELRDAAFDALAEAIKTEAEAGPLLIVVEDAHWLDATSQEFIERLLDRLQHLPVMVLVTHRPEFTAPWAQHGNVGLLSLSRLGKRDARAIVNSLLSRGQTLSQELAEDIIAKSDGVPLFVEELTGSALEAARSPHDRAIQIPATLRDALSERLDRLGNAKEVAQIAAAFGREFALDLVAATLGRPETVLQVDIDRLIAIDVVSQVSRSARRYMFRHALLQDAAYDSMLKTRRREVHARIVAVLGKLRPEMAETEPEVLASHLTRAGESQRAAECWQKAGHLALRNSAYREAIGAFNRTLQLFAASEHKARADVHRALVLAYFPSGEHRMVREHLELAAADAEAAGDQVMMAEIAMQQGHDLIQYGGGLSDAIRYCERALEIATRLDDEALAYGARFSIGQARWITGNYAEAIRVLTQNLPENLRHPDQVRDFVTAGSTMMDSVALLAASCAYRGEFAAAFAYLERAQGMVGPAAFDFAVVQAHLNRAHLQRGDAAIALPLLEKAVQHALDFGQKFLLPWLRGMLGYSRTLMGEVERAVETLRLAVKEAEQIGAVPAEVACSSFLSETLIAVDADQARETAEAALATARANGLRGQEAELLRVRGAALAEVDAGAGVASVRQGLALARTLGMRPEEGHALRVLGDIAEKSGESGAQGHHDAARAIYRELGMAYWLDRMG